MARRGAGDRNLGEAVDAAVIFAVLDVRPGAVRLLDLDDCVAPGRLHGADLVLRRLGGGIVLGQARPHDVRIGILIVDAQQPVLAVARADGQRQVADEVAIVAELLGLAVRTDGGGIERHVPGDRVAPPDQHVGVVAGRHVVSLVVDARQFRKVQRTRGRPCTLRPEAGRSSQRGRAGKSHQGRAPAQPNSDDILVSI